MLPLLGLLPLALQLLPGIGRWLGGDDGQRVGSLAASAIHTVTGTDDPAEARAALDADPAKLAEVTAILAGIAAAREKAKDEALISGMRAENERMAAHLADTANARARDLALRAAGGSNKRAQLLVITNVLLMIAVLAVFAFARPTSGSGFEGLLIMAFGVFIGCYKDVFGFDFGSSAGSKGKDATIDRMADQMTQQGQQPTAVATTGNVTVQEAPRGFLGTPSPAGTTADDLMDRWGRDQPPFRAGPAAR